MQKVLHDKQISIKTTVLSLFFALTIILSTIFISQLYIYGKKLSYDSIDTKISSLVHSVFNALTAQEQINTNIVTILQNNNTNNKTLYTNILKNNPNLYALYTGTSKGGFYEIINFDIHPSLRKIYDATTKDRWLLIEIEDKNNSKKRITFLNQHLESTHSAVDMNSYDPRLRPWYKKAITTNTVIKTKPYTFSNIDAKGITYAKQIKSNNTVVAIDVLLYDLKALFARHINNSYTDVYLYDKDKKLISSLHNNALLKQFFSQGYESENFLKPQSIILDGKKYIAQIKPLHTTNGEMIAIFAKYDQVTKPYNEQMYTFFAIFIISALIVLPMVFYLAHLVVKPIYKLIAQSKKVKKREFSKIKKIHSPILEVSQLSNAMMTMSQAIYSYQTSLEEKVEQRTKELNEKNCMLLKLSITDKLTNLYNRVKLDEELKKQYELAKRYNTKFSLMLLDIDFFKQVNDIHGHKIGDDVLIEVAKVLTQSVRNTDIVGRWGGEEFLVIAPQTLINDTKALALKIKQNIANHTFSTYAKQITLSIGVCEYSHDLDIEDMLLKSDEALYKAKENGRDRVELAEL